MEALVLSERNRGNDFLRLLNEANVKLDDERNNYSILEERFLIAVGAIKMETVANPNNAAQIKAFGGVESLGSKQRRLHHLSVVKKNERLKADNT